MAFGGKLGVHRATEDLWPKKSGSGGLEAGAKTGHQFYYESILGRVPFGVM